MRGKWCVNKQNNIFPEILKQERWCHSCHITFLFPTSYQGLVSHYCVRTTPLWACILCLEITILWLIFFKWLIFTNPNMEIRQNDNAYARRFSEECFCWSFIVWCGLFQDLMHPPIPPTSLMENDLGLPILHFLPTKCWDCKYLSPTQARVSLCS